ncbi:MAG TPA: Dyp-type peroxidase [Pyrinomonadaceae bacterium]|jgi:Dyp-type peroxidase family
MAELERQDIQGLVISGYAHLPCASYQLLRIEDAAAAQRWLGRLIEEVTTSERKQEGTCLNVALTHRGLERLGLDADTLDTFARSFQEGMATTHRSRILGDAGENDPSNWEWGGSDEAKAVDILLLLFGANEETLEDLIRRQRANFTASGIVEFRALGAGRQPDSHEHFSFADGMGQPVIEGSPSADKAAPRNLVKAGEILLSHTNDYGRPADTPQVKPALDPNRMLPDAPPVAGITVEAPLMRDLGRNGSYLVFRQYAQHVADFWRFMDDATRRADGEPDRAASVRLAAKCVGRWPSGAPLTLSPEKDNPELSDADDFGYYDTDAHGFRCPIGSHIRRSNPRDSLGPDQQTALASANRHRILRRGRSYGHRPEDPRVDDGVDRGLHFICLNSDLERQFEFVQQTWINNPVFGGLNGEVDPLIGNLARGDAIMTVQADPLRTRVHNLRSFITLKGGAYFFLPSMTALRYLSSL